MTTHPSRHMPPHGQAAWDGTAGLGATGDVPSILTGERRPVAEGDIVYTHADEGARGGMVIAIEVDEFGERQLTILTHNEMPTRPQAWTLRLAESDVDPAKTTPGSSGRRHAYAKVCYSVAAHGRYVTDADLRLAGIAAALVAGHIAGKG